MKNVIDFNLIKLNLIPTSRGLSAESRIKYFFMPLLPFLFLSLLFTTSFAAQTNENLPSQFTLRGAMAAHHGKQGFSAEIRWEYKAPNYWQIRLFGPLGSGSVMVEQNGGTIRFRDGSKTVTSNDPDMLFKQQTGVRIPVTHLSYWVRGRPAPGKTSHEVRDSSGYILSFQQDGFAIEYKKYIQTARGILPSYIRVKGQGTQVKLIIKNWRV